MSTERLGIPPCDWHMETLALTSGSAVDVVKYPFSYSAFISVASISEGVNNVMLTCHFLTFTGSWWSCHCTQKSA